MRRPQKVRLFGVGTHILDGLFYLNFKNVLFHRNTDAWQIYINGAMSRRVLPPEPVHQRQGFIGFHGHADTFFSVFRRNLPGYPPDHRILIDVHSALKIQILAPEVHVDGAHHCLFIVTDKGLGMDKTRQVLIDLHSGLH